MSNQHNSPIEESLEQLKREREQRQKPTIVKRAKWVGATAWRFISNDIWRLREHEQKGVRGFLVKVFKVVYISVKEFIEQEVTVKASALTYSTLFALVPLLVVVMSVTAGLGMSETVQRSLYEAFPAHQEELTVALGLVESYVESIQGGVVIGVGIAILFYTIIMLFVAVEDTVNQLWQIKKGRPWGRRIVAYFAGFIIFPLAVLFSSLSNIFIRSLSDITLLGAVSLSPLAHTLLKVLPFVVLITVFTTFYLVVPNAKVRFIPALISGVVVGVAFQYFQMLYISGQIWVSRYNSIYGSIAAVPLLMLYINFSWMLALLGTQLCYAIQNVKRYAFKKESETVSRRYRDFVALVLMKKVCRGFIKERPPYNAEELALRTDLPIAVVSDTLDMLVASRLLTELPVKRNKWAPKYLPAVDTSTITVGRVMAALDRLGSESFRVDIYDAYAEEWDLVRRSRRTREMEMDTLVANIG